MEEPGIILLANLLDFWSLNMSKFEIEVVSYLDKKELLAEIYYNALQWAEIYQKKDRVLIKIFPHPDEEYWEFSCEEALETIKKAKIKLTTSKNKTPFLEKTAINKQGEDVLRDILNHPEKESVQYTHEMYGPVIEIEAPQIGGARFTRDGKELIGFLEPKWFKK